MKRFFFTFLLFSVIGNSNAQVTAAASAVIPFDSSLLELNSGTMPTFPSPSSYSFIEDRNGNANSAVKLQTILDYGNPDFSNMDSSDFTIAFWFRKDGSLWSEKSILQKKNVDFSDPNDPIYEEYGMFYNDWVGNSAQIRFKPFKDSAGINSSLGFIDDNVWRHFALVFDRSDSLYAYLDGQLFNTKYIGNTEQHEANIDSAVLEVGNGNISLDDIYFFRSALSATEINEVFTSDVTSIAVVPCYEEGAKGIHPNPSATGLFNISFPCEINNTVQIHVYDMLGREVEFTLNQTPDDSIELQLNNRTNGIYKLHIQIGAEMIVETISLN